MNDEYDLNELPEINTLPSHQPAPCCCGVVTVCVFMDCTGVPWQRSLQSTLNVVVCEDSATCSWGQRNLRSRLIALVYRSSAAFGKGWLDWGVQIVQLIVNVDCTDLAGQRSLQSSLIVLTCQDSAVCTQGWLCWRVRLAQLAVNVGCIGSLGQRRLQWMLIALGR